MEEREKIYKLANLSEEAASSLSKDDWYARLRYLREKEGMRALGGCVTPIKKDQPASDVRPFKPKNVPNYWEN